MALDAHIVNEMRASGNNNNGGGTRWVSLVDAAYKWTPSGSGIDEYYVELAGGGDPSLTEPNNVTTDGNYNIDANGTLGSLNAGEWDWGDNDTLGYSTVYVRLDDGADPDTKNDKFVSMVFGGGVDYSMQDAAQVTQTDYACVIASTTLTSATGGFTALMVGSLFHPTAGTNVLLEWFEIVGFTDGNTVTLDRTCCDGVGNATGVTGFVGGARALPVDAHFEAWTAGNKMYMEAGTYTLSAAIGVAADLLCLIEGYQTTRGDNPTGTNRPLVAAAANTFNFDNEWQFKNIRCTTTTADGFRADNNAVFINCKSDNSSGTATRHGFETTSRAIFIDCEGISTNGRAFFLFSIDCRILNCYAHDSDEGINLASTSQAEFCILDTCSTYGIRMHGTANVLTALNNTIYNCGVGISILSGGLNVIRNNQLADCTTGIDNAGDVAQWYLDYNNYHSNTDNLDNLDYGDNATFNDPGFANEAGGDFSIGTDETANGFGTRLGVGATPSAVHQGAYQPAGSAGGLLTHPGMAGGIRG